MKSNEAHFSGAVPRSSRSRRTGFARRTLTDDERETLGQWARRPKTAQALAQRARMVLECSKGKTNTAVAAELRVSQATVGKWRSRFLESRLAAAGRPRTSPIDVERVVTLTLETTPKDATRSTCAATTP